MIIQTKLSHFIKWLIDVALQKNYDWIQTY
jgi:hypothetical protein